MTNENRIEWKLWVQWVLVYVISTAIGFRIAIRLPHLIDGNSIEDALYEILGWLIYSFIVGFAQWLVLFQYGISGWWIPVTIIGVFFSFIEDGSFLLVSVLQSLVLWRRVRWAGLWIVAHLPSFLYQWVLEWTINQQLPVNWSYTDRMFFSFLMGILIGAIFSGFALVWLLRYPKLKNLAP